MDKLSCQPNKCEIYYQFFLLHFPIIFKAIYILFLCTVSNDQHRNKLLSIFIFIVNTHIYSEYNFCSTIIP